ncbi:ribosome-inactivating family protein [Hymenobacter sp. HSC-4F20]|uniref:ribosome-inactivating family protein n=1 Tax=Hymenobacter sp. HSC-4F20 TaxID=2864135 RepID=UPI001C72EABB|nr:ribosome-inactivating family protein [Hymenobacter sp. HSC-4F20]MBX0292900.1 ribosome-inactivating family protein [Hymenobacter sp. HSC-4F20]
MKTPAEYLDCPVFELTYPTGETAESVPVVAYNDAMRAVEQALADAEKYKYLLMRALRRHAADTKASYPAVPVLPLPEEATDTPVRPLYPDLAA